MRIICSPDSKGRSGSAGATAIAGMKAMSRTDLRGLNTKELALHITATHDYYIITLRFTPTMAAAGVYEGRRKDTGSAGVHEIPHNQPTEAAQPMIHILDWRINRRQEAFRITTVGSKYAILALITTAT